MRQRGQRRGWAGGVVAVVLGLAAWWWLAPVETPRSAASASAAPSSRLAALAPFAAAPVSAVTLPTPAAVLRAGEVQVCGGSWVRLDADGNPDPTQLDGALNQPAARERILATMRADSSDISRASLLVLAMISADDERRRRFLGFLFDCDTPECRIAPEAVKDADDARDALARMASASTDPKVYALAFNVCGGRAGGACSLLNAAQWARLDNGNAQPWLHLLNEAQARKDGAAEQEALHRIATARRIDVGYFDLAGRIISAAPDDDAALAASHPMAIGAIGASAAWTSPYQAVTRACKGEALQDPNRLQTCLGVAETMAERSDTVLTRLIGAAIGRRVGWPDERADRMRAEYSAYTESTLQQTPDAEPYGCGAIHRGVEQIRRHATLTETGAVRQWAREPGRDLEAFIRKEGERRVARDAQEAARIAAAASGASAPSGPAR